MIEQLVVREPVQVDGTFRGWAAEGLVWLPERGMGYYPVREQPYDEAYFAKYEAYARTEMGLAITAARVELVRRHARGEVVVDIGIGCGAFVEAMDCYGFDINPAGARWLQQHGAFWNPYKREAGALTFWDCLEHIHDPAPLLAHAREWVFCSLPLFEGPEHVLRSKHFRRDEHCWYWTRAGLIGWMAEHGFRCVEHNTAESLLGREDIHSFAFRRHS